MENLIFELTCCIFLRTIFLIFKLSVSKLSLRLCRHGAPWHKRTVTHSGLRRLHRPTLVSPQLFLPLLLFPPPLLASARLHHLSDRSVTLSRAQGFRTSHGGRIHPASPSRHHHDQFRAACVRSPEHDPAPFLLRSNAPGEKCWRKWWQRTNQRLCVGWCCRSAGG